MLYIVLISVIFKISRACFPPFVPSTLSPAPAITPPAPDAKLSQGPFSIQWSAVQGAGGCCFGYSVSLKEGERIVQQQKTTNTRLIMVLPATQAPTPHTVQVQAVTLCGSVSQPGQLPITINPSPGGPNADPNNAHADNNIPPPPDDDEDGKGTGNGKSPPNPQGQLGPPLGSQQPPGPLPPGLQPGGPQGPGLTQPPQGPIQQGTTWSKSPPEIMYPKPNLCSSEPGKYKVKYHTKETARLSNNYKLEIYNLKDGALVQRECVTPKASIVGGKDHLTGFVAVNFNQPGEYRIEMSTTKDKKNCEQSQQLSSLVSTVVNVGGVASTVGQSQAPSIHGLENGDSPGVVQPPTKCTWEKPKKGKDTTTD